MVDIEGNIRDLSAYVDNIPQENSDRPARNDDGIKRLWRGRARP